MADDSPSPSPAIGDPNSQKSDPNTPNSKLNPSPTPPPPPQVASLEPTLVSHPSTNIPPPYAPPQIPGAPVASLPPPPPFRPGLQFAPVASFQNPSISTLGVPPPGVSSAMPMAPPGSVPPPMTSYQAPPGQVPAVTALRPFPPIANGYAGMPGVAPHGVMPPPGIPRYPSPYAAMIRPGFPLRPPGALGTVPLVPRPPVPGMPGVRPVMPPVFRPAAVPSVTPAEEPQTTIYIGKIATVENDFMLSILQFCGPVKHWIRAQDPTTGKPKGFGFYEFESAEGALRTIRLLSKLIIDGQELLVNVNQATKKYLLRYVEKKMENAKKAKESQAVGSEESKAEGCEEEKEKEKMDSSNKNESTGLIKEETKNEGEPKSKENIDIANSAVVSDEEREADREALEKIKNAIEERIKTKPLPPPPPPPSDGSGMELAVKAKDGDDADMARNDDVDHKSEVETSSEQTRPDTSSPDWNRKHDRRSRDREKDQEMDRYEREAERERARKEREQRRKLEDAERAYQARLRQWERREREKEKEWQYEKEREKEKERKRKKEIRHDEDEDDDEDDSRRRWHRSSVEDRRRRRLREKEDDLADRLKEEEEVAEAKRKAEEEKLQQQHLDALRLLSGQSIVGSEKVQTPAVEGEEKESIQSITESAHGNHLVDIFQNGSDNETPMAVDNGSETQQGENAPSKKLGFGLIGSGKRTTVPSVFHEEDEEAHKDKKLRPLVPIDYSTEEQQAVQIAGSGDTPPHLAAAAEFAKRLSNSNPKETSESERERSRRSDKGSHRDKDRSQDSGKEPGKAKTPDTKKLLDAKQLIDTIPKTKDELFSYEINWAIYDKHQLHERMRPWISKKITEFLGEEETTLVDYIVSNTQEHVKASQMLELLQSILDEEAEMFVLKMWRMLIFEIKRVESGLPVKSKA